MAIYLHEFHVKDTESQAGYATVIIASKTQTPLRSVHEELNLFLLAKNRGDLVDKIRYVGLRQPEGGIIFSNIEPRPNFPIEDLES